MFEMKLVLVREPTIFSLIEEKEKTFSILISIVVHLITLEEENLRIFNI